MEVNRNCIFLLLFSFLLLFTLFDATQAHVRSLQSAHAINESGKEINLATNFTKIDKLADEGNDGHELMRRTILKSTENSTENSTKKFVYKKNKKKKKKKSAATTSHGNPSLALLFSTFLLGFAALLVC